VKTYSFQIRKADHIPPSGRADLHVHVYFNQGQSRRLLGRYRLPTLEPVFPGEPELNETEQALLRQWLVQPEQFRKLESCLRDTLFDFHRVVAQLSQFSGITAEKGETFITIRLPVARRLE
jgi:hypothetical protein